MSREPSRKGYYGRDRDRDVRDRERDRNWDRHGYRGYDKPHHGRKRSRSRSRDDKRRSRSPRKNDKDILDENILSEISKLPEPSELWDNQFQEAGFSGPPPPQAAFQPEVMSNANFPAGYQASYPGVYDDFPPVASVPQAPLPPDIAAWNQMSLPPPPGPPAPFVNNVEDQIKKEAAIESEMRHQKAALSKQREDYIKKAGILKKELDTLKDQRNELRGDTKRSPSPDTKRFLKENTKLQLEIQNKLKTINNVVDMLNGIIGEEAQEVIESDDSADRSSKRKSRSPSNNKCNYVYYDPEMHWCRVCNDFPPTAKDYLNHLHSPAHHKMAAAHMEAPWHTVSGMNEGFPNFASAPTKRTPIKGLQFFVPSTAWYCKLCDQFIGDLHCASAHLKSIVHSKNYTNFVEQNPHWETDWMSDRQKAFEKSRASKGTKTEEKPQYTAHTITFNKDGFHTKRKDSPTPTSDEKKKKKDKKKKSKRKRSSSSSSSSNSSSSDSEPIKKKKVKSKKEKKFDPDDKTLTEWMSSIQMDKLNDNDRKLLDNLKIRMKLDNIEDDKRRSVERDRERERDRDRSVHRDRERERDRDRERDRAEQSRKLRESVKRESRESRSREESRRRSPPRSDTKKPEIRKMPFIGKMPVYKSLKGKNDDQKKEEQKKKDDDEANKKRREEMDAEIQKKVAEFKEKITKAQLERSAQECLPPPGVALPTALGAGVYLPHLPAPAPAPAPAAMPHTAPTPQPAPALPKDFQEALEIIFPSEVKAPDLGQQDGLFGLPPFHLGPLNPFQPLGLMQPQMPQMFGFDLNAPRFPMPQLYDTHVPLVPNKRPNNKNGRKNDQKNQNKKPNPPTQNQNQLNQQENKASQDNKNNAATAAKIKEELDDLAMLGIDASDVGAGI